MIRTHKKNDKSYLEKNFQACEFDCKGGDCSQTLIDTNLVEYLQKIRDHFGKPVYINSAYRCANHNKKVGGATNSYHTKGMAADFYIDGVNTLEIAKYAESLGILGIGHYDTFVHIDTRTNKSFWYSSKEEYRETFGGKTEEQKSNEEVKKIINDIKNLLTELESKIK